MIHLLTFGGGSQDMKDAALRLVAQAKASGLFDVCVARTDDDLAGDSAFQAQHGAFVRNNPRGFGYWIWKPYLIENYLKGLPDGDILFYCDAGCEINPFAADRFDMFVARVKSAKLLCFEMQSRHSDSWSKGDLVARFPALRGRKQIEATVLGFLASTEARAAVSDWHRLCCEDDYRYLDDTASLAPNDPSFVEHRHDQSCLNAILHTRTEPLPDRLIYPRRKIDTPIVPLRNRAGKPQTRGLRIGPLGFLLWIRPVKRPKLWLRIIPKRKQFSA